MQEIKVTVSNNDEQFKEQTRRLIREESYELKQREARECNIIISNMSEEEEASDEEDGSSDTDTGAGGGSMLSESKCGTGRRNKPIQLHKRNM